MLEELLDVLAPQKQADGSYLGRNMHPRAFRIYGGQVLAQAVASANHTVDPERGLHSQHAYFLRPGDPKLPVQLEVELARDGGSFSSRRVVASQRGKPILVSSLSYQKSSRGEDWQSAMPELPGPEGLVSHRQKRIEQGNLDEDFMITSGLDLEMRRVVQPAPTDSPRETPRLAGWIRTTAPLADDPRLHQTVLAYMSDTMLLDVCLSIHGKRYDDPELQIASLDHALWLHAEFRADEWLLHVAEAERVSGGRSLARGRFYTRAGKLVATTMQQGVMRYR